jgi:ParB family transcriptional regulator, chromosome partitioning protein
MADDFQKPRLGRGLAALLGGSADENTALERGRSQKLVPVAFLRPNPRNPRKTFAPEELDELAASIRERGLIQPIVARSVPGLVDAFEIIAGERRWRAAQRAGLHEVPLFIVEADDKTSLELAIIENVQRSDLNAIEEAKGYDQLMQEFGYSQTELANILGKSRSHLANILRLLKLSLSIQAMLASGAISAGHARALLSLPNPEEVAQRIIDEGLSVRDVERLGQNLGQDSDFEKSKEHKKAQQTERSHNKDPDTVALEKALEDVLGMPVSVMHHGEGGELRIAYANLEQLDGLCRQLKNTTL